MFDSLTKDGFYQQLADKVDYLLNGIHQVADKHGIAIRSNRLGGMFGLFFTDNNIPQNFDDVSKTDNQAFAQFFHGMLDNGIYLAPSAFEAAFMSSAHSMQDLDATILAADKVFADMKSA